MLRDEPIRNQLPPHSPSAARRKRFIDRPGHGVRLRSPHLPLRQVIGLDGGHISPLRFLSFSGFFSRKSRGASLFQSLTQVVD